MSRLTTLEGYIQENQADHLSACDGLEVQKAFRLGLKTPEVAPRKFTHAICRHTNCDNCAIDSYTEFEELLTCLD